MEFGTKASFPNNRITRSRHVAVPVSSFVSRTCFRHSVIRHSSLARHAANSRTVLTVARFAPRSSAPPSSRSGDNRRTRSVHASTRAAPRGRASTPVCQRCRCSARSLLRESTAGHDPARHTASDQCAGAARHRPRRHPTPPQTRWSRPSSSVISSSMSSTGESSCDGLLTVTRQPAVWAAHTRARIS